jgi:hypothetical protein
MGDSSTFASSMKNLNFNWPQKKGTFVEFNGLMKS